MYTCEWTLLCQFELKLCQIQSHPEIPNILWSLRFQPISSGILARSHKQRILPGPNRQFAIVLSSFSALRARCVPALATFASGLH